MAGEQLPVDGVMVGGTTWPATVNLGLSVGKHSGTVRIGKTAAGVFVVVTLSTSRDRLTGLECEVGVGRLIHKSSGTSSSCVTGRGRLATTSRASSSRRRRVFILRSVGESSLAGGMGTERVLSRNCLMGELMTEQCETATYGRGSVRAWSTTTAGRSGGAPGATGGAPWDASPNDWVGACTMDADDVDVTG